MDSILCALDLSSDSRLVAAWAAMFARSLGLPLIVLHAVHVPSDAVHPSAEFERGGDLAVRLAQSSTAIEAVMQSIDVAWNMEVVYGEPAEMVQRYCRTHHVALVVAGSRHMSGLKRFLLGTVVERLVRSLPCPMLVVRPSRYPVPRLGIVGVCCDHSESGSSIAAWGVDVARSFEAELRIYSALESTLYATSGNVTELPYTEAQNELKMQWRNDLISMVPREIRDDLNATVHLVLGDALDEIPDLVDTQRPDLLLVGVRSRSTLGQWMAGSTTEALLRKAPCPVLAIPLGSLGKAFGWSGPGARISKDRGTGIVRDQRMLAHRSAGEHPESPRRLESIYEVLDADHDRWPLVSIACRSASLEELTQVHSLDYVLMIAATARQEFTQLTPDSYACSHSYEAAASAAGAVLAAIDAVVDGSVRNAFVPVRPPGHHAESGKANGFCLFNNVALGAEYARAMKGMQRVLIVDWDLHHGNGTQHIFEDDPTVLYLSTHQYPAFPGTGHFLEVGRGRGEGYTVNLPLGRGWTDGDYVALFQRLVIPLGQSFRPDLILVSAGFDIHKKDPLGRMRVTEAGFAALTRCMMVLAHTCCRDRLVLVLEGGYDTSALAGSVCSVLSELSDQTHADLDKLASKARNRKVRPVVKRCTEVHGHIWPCLREWQWRKDHE